MATASIFSSTLTNANYSSSPDYSNVTYCTIIIIVCPPRLSSTPAPDPALPPKHQPNRPLCISPT